MVASHENVSACARVAARGGYCANSLAQASADQKIVQSKRAVEIETLKAQAEVEPLKAQAEQLRALRESGPGALASYVRNVRLNLFRQAERVIMEVEK